MSQLKDVYDEWQNNLTFRAHFKKDPEAALKAAGLELSPEDLKKIRASLHNNRHGRDDEELSDRISK